MNAKITVSLNREQILRTMARHSMEAICNMLGSGAYRDMVDVVFEMVNGKVPAFKCKNCNAKAFVIRFPDGGDEVVTVVVTVSGIIRRLDKIIDRVTANCPRCGSCDIAFPNEIILKEEQFNGCKV